MGRENTAHTRSQNKMILEYLQDHKSISQYEAADIFGCWRLSARISDLRDLGYSIKTEMIKTKNRYGHTVMYGRYSLEAAEQEA